jgi:deoxyribonuclease IV
MDKSITMRIGLKLFTTNNAQIPLARELYAKGCFDFIELYVIPNTYAGTIHDWKQIDIPVVIHAPHSIHGFNLAQSEKGASNNEMFQEVQMVADSLSATIIIVHGGNNGSLEETIRQLRLLNDRRIILENKPLIGIHGETCVGCTPAEMNKVEEAGVLNGIALDFGHALCTANALEIDVFHLIEGLAAFTPKIYHLSDGNASSKTDTHYNLGKGDFLITRFLSLVPSNALLTLETPRDTTMGLHQFVDDVQYLRSITSSLSPEATSHD